MAASAEAPAAVLEGVFVLELGSRIGAAVAGSTLAQLGATVVFVEVALREEDAAGAHAEGLSGKQQARAAFAAGKLSLVVDPASADDRALLGELVQAADAVLVSGDVDPPAFDALVKDAAAATTTAASAGTEPVVCDVTACGSIGPLAGQPYAETEIQALTGILEATGLAGRAPTPIGLPVVEHMAGLYAAAGVLAALRVRRTQGFTQKAEVALYDVGFAAMSSFLAPAFLGQKGAVTRVGNRHTMAAPWNVYHATDGWVLLCSGSDEQWQRLVQLVGRPELAADPAFAKNADRVAHVDAVDAVVQGWVGRHAVEEALGKLSALGLPCGRVAPIDGHPREANLEHRRMVRRAREPAVGHEVAVAGSPFTMSRTPGRALTRIPAPDVDREAVRALARRASPSPARAAATVTVASRPPRPVLDGVRVIEIGHYTTVPVAARSLAALGAEVIKIEPPHGEAVRRWPPARDGQGLFFTFQNSDKKSVCLELDAPEGRERLRRLVASADILVENLRPGALARKGFGTDDLLRLNPRLVVCAISGFGADSLYPGRPAFDAVIQATSGLMDVTRVDGAPLKTGPSLADVMGAVAGLMVLLAALEHRDRTGEGQFIDLSMQDVAAWSTQTLWNGRSFDSGFQVVACADGHVLADGLAEGPAPAPGTRAPGARLGAAARVDITCAAFVDDCRRIGRRAVPVHGIDAAVAAGHTAARRLWFPAARGDSSFPLLALPLRLERTPAVVSRPAPALDADAAEVWASLREKPAA